MIPKFASSLDKIEKSRIKTLKLNEELHKEGINVRHLGRVRAHLSSPYMSQYFLLEMIARVVKRTIRACLRKKMEEIKIPASGPYKQDIAEYLNILLGNRPESETYWKVEMIDQLKKKFGQFAVSPKEIAPDAKRIDYEIDRLQLLTRVQVLTGIKLASRAIQQLSKNPQQAVFVEPDLEKIGTQVKDMVGS